MLSLYLKSYLISVIGVVVRACRTKRCSESILAILRYRTIRRCCSHVDLLLSASELLLRDLRMLIVDFHEARILLHLIDASHVLAHCSAIRIATNLSGLIRCAKDSK